MLKDFGGGGYEFGWEFEGVVVMSDEVFGDVELVLSQPREEGLEKIGRERDTLEGLGGGQSNFEIADGEAFLIRIGLVVILNEAGGRFGDGFPALVGSGGFSVLKDGGGLGFGEFFEGGLDLSLGVGEGAGEIGKGDEEVALEMRFEQVLEVIGRSETLGEEGLLAVGAEVTAAGGGIENLGTGQGGFAREFS